MAMFFGLTPTLLGKYQRKLVNEGSNGGKLTYKLNERRSAYVINN